MAIPFTPKSWKGYAVLAGIAIIALAAWLHLKWKYPYGYSHCCSKAVGLGLRIYANDHNGFFPAGGRTPEASLSFLYTNGLQAEILRGKIIPLRVTQAALDKDGVLGPESCGWHYVEGLTEVDDPRIAIVWDKVGLDHHGGRFGHGGREVVMLDGSVQRISGAAWPGFLAEQALLLAARDERARTAQPALVAKIKLPDGRLLDTLPGNYELSETYSSGQGSSSGSSFDPRWPRMNGEDGSRTFVLIFTGRHLRSKPVTVEVRNGSAAPHSIVFEMENY